MSDPTRMPQHHGYWQSLAELSGDGCFEARLDQEFPDTAIEAPDGLSRRSMLRWYALCYLRCAICCLCFVLCGMRYAPCALCVQRSRFQVPRRSGGSS